MNEARRVLVLGGRGMLGHMVASALGADERLQVRATARPIEAAPGDIPFDARHDRVDELLESMPIQPHWIVNALGVIKPRIGADVDSRRAAIAVNADLPHRLAAAAEQRGIGVIQPATDGVFAAAGAPFDEQSRHAPEDVYAMTKSLGEVPSSAMLHLRASIVGPELGDPSEGRSLLSWLLSRPRGERIEGYVNHRWNGVTTWHFTRVVCGIVSGETRPCGVQHLVPADDVTKHELLVAIAAAYGRNDLEIVPAEAATPADRRLTTNDPQRNAALWRAAGYEVVPSVCAMINELASHRPPPSPADS
jgi:dTDP-4-dehydrorhamnose reductase